jgi:hypothetical protein
MEIENVVGVKFGIQDEIDMEDGNRGWDLEDIAGDSLRPEILAWLINDHMKTLRGAQMLV